MAGCNAECSCELHLNKPPSPKWSLPGELFRQLIRNGRGRGVGGMGEVWEGVSGGLASGLEVGRGFGQYILIFCGFHLAEVLA